MSRREEILAASKRVIAEQGYSDTSMRDIADASGLMAGSLYSHFRSKAALVAEIVGGFYDELIPAQVAIVSTETTGADQLRAMIEAVYTVCANHSEELTILHYDWHALSTLEELAEVHARSEETLGLWSAAVERGVADGSLRPEVDANAMVRIATSSIHGLIDTVRYASQPMPRKTGSDSAAILQMILLSGVSADSSHDALALTVEETNR